MLFFPTWKQDSLSLQKDEQLLINYNYYVVFLLIAPPVYTVADRFFAIEGDILRIDPILDAIPFPTIFSWTRNGVPYTPPSGGSVGADFIDFGGPIDRSVAGTYMVSSTNDAGTGSATFELIIYCELNTTN